MTICFITKYILTIFFIFVQKYNEWKDSMPDLGWLENLMPTEEHWQDFRKSLMTVKNTVADKIEIGEHNKYIVTYICEKHETKKMS